MHAQSSNSARWADNGGREELTQEDLDFVRKLCSGEWCVFQVPLGGGRFKTRHMRILGRKVFIVDQIDVLSDQLPLPWLER
jgi:hypothetical protein